LDDDEIQPLTPEQVNLLLDALDTVDLDRASGTRRPHRNAALYYVAIRCGLRKGELLGLRWKDVDLKRRKLHVSGQLQAGKRTKTKTKRGRTVPLSSDTVRALEWHKANQAEERKIAAADWNAAGLVFVSETGNVLSQSNVTRQLDGLLRCLKLPNIRFHDLRYTYAALSIAAKVDLFTLSRRMGHSSITVTADRYGRLYAGNTEDADALDRLLQKHASNASTNYILNSILGQKQKTRDLVPARDSAS
jgi:integrase